MLVMYKQLRKHYSMSNNSFCLNSKLTIIRLFMIVNIENFSLRL